MLRLLEQFDQIPQRGVATDKFWGGTQIDRHRGISGTDLAGWNPAGPTSSERDKARLSFTLQPERAYQQIHRGPLRTDGSTRSG